MSTIVNWEGRRPYMSNKPWSSRFLRTVEYWNTLELGKYEDTKETFLKVVGLNLNLSDNTQAHHTNEYDVIEEKNCLVARRGQAFDLDIELDKAYDKEKDDLRIVFEFGKEPKLPDRTSVQLVLSDKDEPKKWGAFLISQDGNTLKVRILTPPDCYVGKWNFKVQDVKLGEEEVTVYRYNHKEPIYILFNPWCKDDEVYMHDTNLLQEYVLKDSGVIFRGSQDSISWSPWTFEQFDDNILDCTLYLLDEVSVIKNRDRGNPRAIARQLSALVNMQDEGGILQGNWSESYEGGTPPLAWTGSGDILEEYYKTKKPVKYGQCWVFSGVFTTLGRALGIPIRSVTNFASAHDTDGSLRIETYYDENMDYIEGYSSDSVWNFHVWNDVWMARPDLPLGYGGWQAVDATPQEQSRGIYCMGPMPLKAIKNGEVYLPYDGPFVFAEVNGDLVRFKIEKDGTSKVIRVVEGMVGKYISTKEPFTEERQDITNQYKFEEGSKEERAAVYRANMKSSLPDFYAKGPEDVELEVVYDKDTFVGDVVTIQVRITNKSDEIRYIGGNVSVSTVYYTGVHHRVIAKEKIQNKLLAPQRTDGIILRIEEAQYLEHLMDHCILDISGIFLVYPTEQFCPIKSQLRLRKPHLNVKAPTICKRGDLVPVEVSFKNPLSVPLTDCTIRMEGPGLPKGQVQKCSDVGPKQEFVGSFQLRPKKLGEKEISISFNSKQLRSINAAHKIHVQWMI